MVPTPDAAWSVLAVSVRAEAAEAVAEYLRTLGATGVALHGGGRRLRVVGYFPPGGGYRARMRALCRFLGDLEGWGLDPGPARVRHQRLRPADWTRSWRREFGPLKVGRRLWVMPAWRSADLPPGELAVLLVPGLAFGTGEHPTTRLCLAELERLLGPGDTVLDCGTGSGVLAVAAAVLGAGRVRAVDCDPLAVAAARATVARNRVATRVVVEQDDLAAWLPRQAPASLVVANLETELIVRLAPLLAGALALAGHLVVSGVPRGRASEAAAALEETGLTLVRRRGRQGWCVLVSRALPARS